MVVCVAVCKSVAIWPVNARIFDLYKTSLDYVAAVLTAANALLEPSQTAVK
ncbi:hypothetical protein A2U01_0045469, partial [Trifolium medium]|nr:hypothetical protein [Trifolium medium]